MKHFLLLKSQIMSKDSAKWKTPWKQWILPSVSFIFLIAPPNSADRDGKKGRSVGVKEWNQEEGKGTEEGKEGERKKMRELNESSRSFLFPQWKLLKVLHLTFSWHSSEIFLNCFNDSLRKYQIQIFLSMIVTCLLLF